MKWDTLRAGVRLGVDWSSHLRKPLDPYLVWADVTDFKGVTSGTSDAARPADTVRLALELAPGAGGTVAGISTRIIVDRPGKRFATAAVSFGQVKNLLKSQAVRRLELGFAGHRLQRNAGKQTTQLARPRRVHPTRTDEPVVAVIDFGCAFAHERFRNRHEGVVADADRVPVGPEQGTRWSAVAGRRGLRLRA